MDSNKRAIYDQYGEEGLKRGGGGGNPFQGGGNPFQGIDSKKLHISYIT